MSIQVKVTSPRWASDTVICTLEELLDLAFDFNQECPVELTKEYFNDKYIIRDGTGDIVGEVLE